MSQGEVVRWPVPPGVPRWGALLPGMPRWARTAAVAALARRLAGSWLRRVVLTGSIRVGFDEMGRRGDRRLDQMFRLYDPACEMHIGPGFPMDAQPVYFGHEGIRAFLRLWDEVSAISFVCEEVLDMGGPCCGLLLSASLIGAESGASAPPVQCVSTYTFGRGGCVRQELRNDGWEVAPEALTAALRQAAVR